MFNRCLNNFFSWIFSKLLLKQVSGVGNIPVQGGYIVSANHISYLDILCVYAVFLSKAKTYIRFIAKKGLLKDAFFLTFRFLFENKQNEVILLDTENLKKTFDDAIKALKGGSVVGIYPEGGRSPDGRIQKGKTGAAKLALLAKVPVIPVGIKGTFELMPRGRSMPKIKKNVEINIGKSINPEKYYNKKITKKMLMGMTNKIMQEIAKLSGQKYKY